MDSSQFKSFKEQIKKSFSACREDIEALQQNSQEQTTQIQQLMSEIKQRDEIISTLRTQVSTTQQQYIETQKSLNIIQETLQQIQSQMSVSPHLEQAHSNSSNSSNNRQETLTNYNIDKNPEKNANEGEKYQHISYDSSQHDFYSQKEQSSERNSIKEASEKKPKKSKDSYEALLEFKAKINKKEMIKQKILSTIPNEGMMLSEIRFLFVEHFNYCSKATFYNYLKELEYSKQIRTEREYSKNFIYLQGSVQPQNSLNSHINLQ